MFTFDYTVTAGNVIEVVGFIGGGIYALATVKSTVKTLGVDVGKMQKEIEKMGEVLTKQAVHDQRLLNLEEDFRDLRKGRGFIQRTANPGIDGEYP